MQVGLLLRPQPAPDRNCVLLIACPIADPLLPSDCNGFASRPTRKQTNGPPGDRLCRLLFVRWRTGLK